MVAFFDTCIWCVSQFVSFLLNLPFMTGANFFRFGYGLIALAIINIIVVALVRSISAVGRSVKGGD